MTNHLKLSNILKGMIVILLILNLIIMIRGNVSASPLNWGYTKYDNPKILKMARDAEGRGDWSNAYAYYSVYLDRAPAAAVKDNKFWSDLNSRWESTKSNSNNEQYFASDVRQLIKQGVFNRDDFVNAGVRGKYSNPPSPLPGMLGPAPDEVLVFKDFEFKGEWMALSIGNYVNASQMEMDDNSISSAMVGTAVRAYLCTDPGLNGTCGVFVPVPNHHPNLSNNTVGNDSVSSIHIEPLTNSCSTGPNEVTIFMHFDYQAPCQTLQIGDYSNSDAFGLPDNGISSIRVGSNVQAYLCQNNNLAGTCDTINYNDNNLSDNIIGNDMLSSLSITPRP